MVEAVYVLCALTSAACVWLLARAFLATRQRLILWSLICFAGLALNNLLLLVDKLVVPDTDLSVIRTLPATLGVGALLFGLIWDARAR